MSQLTPGLLNNPEGTSFRDLTIEKVLALRTDLMHLLSACGLTVRKSKDLQTHFGVDYTLSWRLYRLLTDEDVLAHCVDIPNAGMMQKLLKAAETRGGTAKLIAAVRYSFAAFEEHVTTFAGDRDLFNVMVTQLVGGELEAAAELSHRKAIFEAYRYIKGLEQECQYQVDFCHPALSSPQRIDYAHLSCTLGLRRLNSQRPLVVNAMSHGDGHEKPASMDLLDPDAFEKYGFDLLPAFCSAPDLPLRTREINGSYVTEWLSDTVGRPSAVDVTVGRVRRAAPHKPIRSAMVTTTPVRLVVHDLLVHRETYGRLAFDTQRWHLETLNEPTPFVELGAQHFIAAGFQQIANRDQQTFMGSGENAAHTADSPRHVELIRFTCGRLGWNFEDFDLYRLRTEYPLPHTLIYSEQIAGSGE